MGLSNEEQILIIVGCVLFVLVVLVVVFVFWICHRRRKARVTSVVHPVNTEEGRSRQNGRSKTLKKIGAEDTEVIANTSPEPTVLTNGTTVVVTGTTTGDAADQLNQSINTQSINDQSVVDHNDSSHLIVQRSKSNTEESQITTEQQLNEETQKSGSSSRIYTPETTSSDCKLNSTFDDVSDSPTADCSEQPDDVSSTNQHNTDTTADPSQSAVEDVDGVSQGTEQDEATANVSSSDLNLAQQQSSITDNDSIIVANQNCDASLSLHQNSGNIVSEVNLQISEQSGTDQKLNSTFDQQQQHDTNNVNEQRTSSESSNDHDSAIILSSSSPNKPHDVLEPVNFLDNQATSGLGLARLQIELLHVISMEELIVTVKQGAGLSPSAAYFVRVTVENQATGSRHGPEQTHEISGKTEPKWFAHLTFGKFARSDLDNLTIVIETFANDELFGKIEISKNSASSAAREHIRELCLDEGIVSAWHNLS